MGHEGGDPLSPSHFVRGGPALGRASKRPSGGDPVETDVVVRIFPDARGDEHQEDGTTFRCGPTIGFMN